MIPGLASAEFMRYGMMHRNTYINGPAHLAPTFALKSAPRVFFAGQITGVEGYLESTASGLAAGIMPRAWRREQSRSSFQARQP